MIFPDWPPRPWVLLAAALVTGLLIFLVALGIDPFIPLGIVLCVVLLLAAPKVLDRLRTLGDRDGRR